MAIPRKLLTLFLIACTVCLSCCLTGIPARADTYLGYVNATDVNIRQDASVSSASLGKVSNVYVTVNGSKKGIAAGDTHTWYYITYNGVSGYIRGDFVELISVQSDATFEDKLSSFPETYRSALRALHTVYPNWNFVADHYSLTLDEAVALEIERKLVQNNSAVSWRSMGSGAYDWSEDTYVPHDTNWYVASREVIRYYLDPRNFLTASDIFMYMQQSYNAATQTEAGLNAIIKNTFLARSFSSTDTVYGGSYAKVIMQAAKESGVNPYVLAAKIIQEQGTSGTSSLISGTYPGYEGYYNFFNVQASGSTQDQKIRNGLQYAKNNGWSSIPAAIIGGAQFCSNGYISAGQDTYFKMDFNLHNPNRIWHEYAGAVHDALNCGKKVSAYYTGVTDASLTFYIPVYQNMPAGVSALPAQSEKKNNYYFTSVQTDGLTPSFSRYIYSYDLRLTGDQSINLTVPDGASYASAYAFPLNAGDNTVTLKVKSESGYTTDYVLHINADKACTLYANHSHSFGDWQTVTACSCVTDGREYRICSSCGKTEERIIPAGHSEYLVYTKAPACAESGYDVVKCAVCGLRRYINQTEPLGHTYTLVKTVAPTCAEDGYDLYRCERCGNTYKDYQAAHGHDCRYLRTVAANCVKDGYHLYVCDRCGEEIKTVLPAQGHLFAGGVCMDCGIREAIAPFDLNGDAEWNAADLAELQGILLRNDPKAACDLNGDGVSNILDLIFMKKKLAE